MNGALPMILTWQNTAPTEEGWYWRKELDGKKGVVLLSKNEGALGFWVKTSRGISGFAVQDLVCTHGWKFAGPLQEPEEEE